MKKYQSIGMVLSAITGLLVLMLVTDFAMSAKAAFDRRQAAHDTLALVSVSREIFLADEKLRIEQGLVSTALAAPTAADAQTQTQIATLHGNASRTLNALFVHIDGTSAKALDIKAIRAAQLGYEGAFSAAMAALRLPGALRPAAAGVRWGAAMGKLVSAGDLEVAVLSDEISGIDSYINDVTKIGRIAWVVRAPAGKDRRMLAAAIESAKPLSIEQHQQFSELTGQIDAPWSALESDVKSYPVPAQLQAAVQAAHKDYFVDLRNWRQVLIDQLSRGQKPSLSAQAWMRLSNQGLDSITAITKKSFDLIQSHVTEQAALANRNFVLSIGSILVALALAGFAGWYIQHRVIKPLKLITDTMQSVVEGDLACKIPLQERCDEIGQFARTLSLFRDGAMERQRLETELVRNLSARETAEASSRIKSEFLANMSHELRTPLNAIIGFSDMMKQKLYGPLCAQYGEYAELIHESGHHLLNLINDILDIAKIEAGKFSLDFQTVDFVESLRYCMQLNQRIADGRGVWLTTDIGSAALPFVADPRAVKQILLNLLSNALKFTGAGGEIHVTARIRDGHLRFTVRDTGVGIPADVLPRIGQAFEQASNDPMRAREGTGLGLALVRALVTRHGGSLKIESQENVGTSVTVELPLAQEARAAA